MREEVNSPESIEKHTHVVDVGGRVRIHLREKRAAKPGPAILLLHGLGVGLHGEDQSPDAVSRPRQRMDTQ